MKSNSKWALLGASRGLGAAFFRFLIYQPSIDAIFLSSRKSNLLFQLQEEAKKIRPELDVTFFPADFSNEEDQKLLLSTLISFKPTTLYYFAGGGPYGEFGKKDWKDHEWAMEVTYNFPAKLIHSWLAGNLLCNHMTLLGSQIAESDPDPFASSYAAAKHALKGLISTLHRENPYIDLRLLSPGYMNTDMLPKNSMPRRLNLPLLDPQVICNKIFEWQIDPNGLKYFKLI